MASSRERFERLCTPNGNIVMVPMDHGISMGPIPGLNRIDQTTNLVAKGGATCLVAHKGIVPQIQAALGEHSPGILLHLSAGTDVGPDPHEKRIIGRVSDALRLGIEGVSIHLNLGSTTEPMQLEQVGQVTSDALDHGVPVLAMVYPRGPKITNPRDPTLVAHAARLGVELGADIVKVPFTGDTGSFEPVVEGAGGIPVVIAGGPQIDRAEFIHTLTLAKAAGARGVSCGRNVFANPNPLQMVTDIRKIFS